ncbi:MAG: hypothetical protein ABI134_19215 [Byssovorax sp.]
MAAKKKTATKTSAKKTTAPKVAAKKPAKPAVKKATASPKPPVPAPKKPATKAAPQAGIAFKSPGFRLTVLNELLDLGHFADGFEEAQEKADEVEEYEIDPRVQKFLDGIALTEELLAQVVKIGPDGGDEVYAGLVPEWDGEDERFDIDSLEDVRLLPNLERVSLYAMVSEGIDLAPLRDVAKLEVVNINLLKGWVEGWEVLDELAARGVEVTQT